MKKLVTLSITLFFYAAVSAQSTGDYRTVTSGNWNNIAIWQRYSGNGWKAATVYPAYTDGAITIKDGHNVTINLALTIDQTTVDGGGQLTLSSNYTVVLNDGADDDLTVNGLLYISTGAITGTGKLILNNQMQWVGGSLQTKISNTGTIMLEGGNCYLYGALTNYGIINWATGRLLFYGGTITNNGDFNAYSNDFLNNQSGGGIFNNNSAGNFNVNVIGNLVTQINFTNKGVINLNSGNFINDGTFTNAKTINFNSGSFQHDGTTSFNQGTKITGSGTLLVYDNTMNVNTSVDLPAGIIFKLGTSFPLLTGTGSMKVSGKFLWYNGTLGLPVTINSNGIMSIDYDNLTLTSVLTNNGTINWNYANIYFNNGSIINNGIFNATSDYQFIKSSVGTFTNNSSGVFTKSSLGTSTINITFINKGTIGGTGTFNFGINLTNTGTFDPGKDTSTAILKTGTDYTNSKLLIDLKGSSPGQQYDRLIVNGNATLKGTLTVKTSGTLPQGADTILATTGTISGKFGTVNLPAGYNIVYKTNRVIIKIPASLASEENMAQATNIDKQFSVSPNPANQFLRINFPPKNKNAGIIIFNEEGKAVYEVKLGNQNSINISNLVPGNYVLQLKDGDKTQSAKFIKQ